MHRTLTASNSRLALSSVIAFVAMACSPHALASEPGPFELVADIPMHGAVNAMREHCLRFESGGEVEFRFSSAWPVDFNVHYHDDGVTEYPVEVSDRSDYEGSFLAEPDREYCYMWVNREYSEDAWLIGLEQRVSATTDEPA